jgi:hypothetical protein
VQEGLILRGFLEAILRWRRGRDSHPRRLGSLSVTRNRSVAIRKNTLAEALGNLRDRPVRGDSFRFCLEFSPGLSGFRALAISLDHFVKNRSESLLTVGSYLPFDLK